MDPYPQKNRYQSLLDTLAALCQCAYVSDLVYTASDQTIRSALRSVAPNAYPTEEWIDAIFYLTRTDFPAFTSQWEAVSYLFSLPGYFKAVPQQTCIPL